jgi:hypothetical protein
MHKKSQKVQFLKNMHKPENLYLIIKYIYMHSHTVELMSDDSVGGMLFYCRCYCYDQINLKAWYLFS